MNKTLLLTLVLAFAFIVFLGSVKADCLGSTYAFPCGSIINESCTFNQTDNCALAGGFAILGDTITVDCDGYAVIGNGIATGFTFLGGTNDVLKDCNITTWGYAVQNTNGVTAKIYNNTISDVSTGGIQSNAGAANITLNDILCGSGAGVGVYLEYIIIDGDNNNVSRNNITDCDTGISVETLNNTIDNNFIILMTSDGIEVLNHLNVIKNNLIYIIGNLGMYIESNSNTVYNNSIGIIGNGGIFITDGDYNNLTQNQVGSVYSGGTDTGCYALTYDSDYNNFTSNLAVTCNFTGFYLGRDAGVNRFVGNTVNMTGTDMDFDLYGFYLDGSDDNYFYLNQVNNFSLDDISGNAAWGFYGYGASVNNISHNDFNAMYQGIEIDTGDSNQIEFNTIDCVPGNDTYPDGIYVTDYDEGADNVIWKNNVTYCSNGINAEYQSNLQVASNRVVHGADTPWAMNIMYCNTCSIVNNYIYNNSGTGTFGLELQYVDSATVEGNYISVTEDCLGFYDLTNTVSIDDNTAIGETATNLVVAGPETLEITNLATDETTIDLLAANITLTDYTGVLPNPNDYKNIGIYYTISQYFVYDPYAYVNMSYNPATVTNESSLEMFRYNGAWSDMTLSGVNTGANYVYSGNIDSFSIFAPMERDNEDTDLDTATCAVMNLIILLCAITIMTVGAGVAVGFYKQAQGEQWLGVEWGMNQIIAAFIAICVLIALIVVIADQYALLCLI